VHRSSSPQGRLPQEILTQFLLHCGESTGLHLPIQIQRTRPLSDGSQGRLHGVVPSDLPRRRLLRLHRQNKHFVNFEVESGPSFLKLNEGDERYKRNCVIYKILCPAGLPIYIGHSTQGLSYRFKQHLTPSSSKPMRVAVFLRANAGCTIEWVQDAKCKNLREALAIETAVIAQFIATGASLLNTKQLPPKAKKARTTVIQVTKFITRKQAWTDDGHRFRVRVDGVRKDFQYGSRVTCEQAAAKAGINLKSA
jgi:hypothetical protein